MDLLNIENNYRKLKNFYLSQDGGERCQIQAENAVKHYGYLPVPFEMGKELGNKVLFDALEKLWCEQGVMREGNFVAAQINPLHRLGYSDSSWIVREQHKIESLNLYGLGEKKNGQVRGCFRNLLVKILTAPGGCESEKIPATTFYLLPPYKRDPAFASVYCPVSAEIDPGIGDSELMAIGLDAERQIQLFIALANLAGHPVLIDLLPQAGRFSKTVFTYPDCFRWFYIPDFVEALQNEISSAICSLEWQNSLPEALLQIVKEALEDDLCGKLLETRRGEEAENLKTAVRTIYHEICKNVLEEEKKEKNTGGVSPRTLRQRVLSDYKRLNEDVFSRFELTNTSFPFIEKSLELFCELDFSLQEARISFSNIMLTRENQDKIVEKARAIISAIAEEIANETELDDQKHLELISAFQQAGFWPVQGGSWNSAGHPVFHRISPDRDQVPLTDHYNYKGNLVNAFAGDMDIVAPWYFAYLGQTENSDNLHHGVVSTYVNYCADIYTRLHPNGFRIDHLDHSADYPVSINSGQNPISYRAPLSVFAELGKKIRQEDPSFALMAEYMGWGDSEFPHLFHKYHACGIELGISTDVVGEYRNNAATIVKEGNSVIAAYNRSKRPPFFSLARVLDNHDRIHPDISPALSEFTQERALLKWCKCLLLPGGPFAQRPVLYLDGNQTHTPNQAFADTFLGFDNLKREKNYRFFGKFDALLRFSLKEPTLMYGECAVVHDEILGAARLKGEANNMLSAWLVWPPVAQLKPILVIAYEWIDDKTPRPAIADCLEIPLPSGYEVDSEISLPNTPPSDSLKAYIENIPEMMEGPPENAFQQPAANQFVVLTVPALTPNQFRIFRLSRLE